jgi:hypothetical protein
MRASAQRCQQRVEQVGGELRVLHHLVPVLIVSGIGPHPKHAGADAIPQHCRDQPAFPPLRVPGGGEAGLRWVLRQLAETSLGLRREHHDLLGQRAAGDRVGPLDAGQRGVERALGQGVLGYRGEGGLRVQLIGQLWLARQESRRGYQRKQLRLLVPPGGCDELLDLPRRGRQGMGQRGRVRRWLAHSAIVASVVATGSSGAATGIGTLGRSVELDRQTQSGVASAAARGSALYRRRRQERVLWPTGPPLEFPPFPAVPGF